MAFEREGVERVRVGACRDGRAGRARHGEDRAGWQHRADRRHVLLPERLRRGGLLSRDGARHVHALSDARAELRPVRPHPREHGRRVLHLPQPWSSRKLSCHHCKRSRPGGAAVTGCGAATTPASAIRSSARSAASTAGVERAKASSASRSLRPLAEAAGLATAVCEGRSTRRLRPSAQRSGRRSRTSRRDGAMAVAPSRPMRPACRPQPEDAAEGSRDADAAARIAARREVAHRCGDSGGGAGGGTARQTAWAQVFFGEP